MIAHKKHESTLSFLNQFSHCECNTFIKKVLQSEAIGDNGWDESDVTTDSPLFPTMCPSTVRCRRGDGTITPLSLSTQKSCGHLRLPLSIHRTHGWYVAFQSPRRPAQGGHYVPRGSYCTHLAFWWALDCTLGYYYPPRLPEQGVLHERAMLCLDWAPFPAVKSGSGRPAAPQWATPASPRGRRP